jgi:hypothetical protein
VTLRCSVRRASIAITLSHWCIHKAG